MKSADLKKMIKEAVKEAIQEELKDILFEAFRAPKTPTAAPVMEQRSRNIEVSQTTPVDPAEKRRLYEQALGETTMNFNSSQAQSFKPAPGYDSANGSLPPGEVDMSQIVGLMNK